MVVTVILHHSPKLTFNKREIKRISTVMKRQSSAVSPSSSRRETAPEKIHVKTIGCMSGILHLISTSHSRRHRRFLTFGKKQTKNHVSSISTATANSQPENAKEKKSDEVCTVRNPRLSSEVPRSPTLPPDIRHSSPAKSSENVREPPALVARLMGLEAVPASPETVVEKRQKLLGALQRCDEDLKALKKIIDAVRTTDPLPSLSPSPVVVKRSIGDLGDKVKTVTEVKCSVVNGEQQQPSPVSVLDEFTRSPLSPNCHSGRYSFARMQQQKHQLLKKPGEEDISNTLYIHERMTSEIVNKKVQEEDRSVMWSNKGMMRSVDEVCRDVAWGENREIGRIGLALQDCICRDLIEEIVRELGCLYTLSLPFESCKRRLCF